MVLIITNNNKIINLIKKYENYKNIELQDNITDISKYVNDELLSRNMEKVERIYFDITSFNNKDEEILNSIMKIKVIYDIQIIILAIGYKVGNILLSQLFENGIYNFVISENSIYQDEEIRKSIKGNTYINAIKFKVDDVKTKKVKKIKIKKNIKKNTKIKKVSKEKLLAFFSLFKNASIKLLKIFSYILVMFFISVGATALINSNIREILIGIIRGGN